MAEFLTEMSDPTPSGDPDGVETRSRCTAGGRVVWVFRYEHSAGMADDVDLV